jgi:hypothetical protein
MNVKRRFVRLCLFVAICPVAVTAQQPHEGSTREYHSLATAEEAVAAALEVTGFRELKEFKLAASAGEITRLTTVCDSTTPFLASDIDGRSAWQVEFDEVILDLDMPTLEDELNNPMRVTILLDSATGELLRIESWNIGRSDTLAREATTAEAAEQLSSGGERYHGLPTNPPAINYCEALNKCKFYPVLSRKIVASYVLHSDCRSSEPKPVWVIHMRGLPALSSNPMVPEYTATNRRTVINAMTGEVLFFTNQPYPRLWEDSAGKRFNNE